MLIIFINLYIIIFINLYIILRRDITSSSLNLYFGSLLLLIHTIDKLIRFTVSKINYDNNDLNLKKKTTGIQHVR